MNLDLRLRIKRLPQKKFDLISHTVIFSIIPLAMLAFLFMAMNTDTWKFWVGWGILVVTLGGHSAACKYMLWARYSCDVCLQKHCLKHWDESERPGK